MDINTYLEEVNRLREDICNARLERRMQLFESQQRLEQVDERLQLLQVRHDWKMRAIMECILKMRSTDMARIMCLRYLENKSWAEIEDVVFLSRSQIFRLHQQGLALLKGRLSGNPIQ